MHDELHRLPDRLRVLKGVYPDYAKMQAATPLWREKDGGNCPNGGLASISLQWRGDRIGVRDIRIAKGRRMQRATSRYDACCTAMTRGVD